MIRPIIVASFIYLLSVCSGATDVLTFEQVKFRREHNGDLYGGQSWTQLEFEIVSPRINGKNYLNKYAIRFTLDADRGSYRRTDIRFKDDWLKSRNDWQSSKHEEMYVGSSKLNSKQKADLSLLTREERIVAAWIISNSSELIKYALNSDKPFAWNSVVEWKKLLRNHIFEKNVRANLKPYFDEQLAQFNKYSRPSEFMLKRQIQPRLAALGFYDGKLDGKFGPATLNAIQMFEASKGRFPDGVLDVAEQQLLKDTALDHEFYSDVEAIKKREVQLTTQIKQLQKKIKAANRQNFSLVQKMRVEQEQSKRLYANADMLKKQLREIEKAQVGQSPELSKEIKSLKESLNTAEAELRKARRAVQKADASIEMMADSNIDLRESNKSLEKKLDERLKIVANLRDRLNFEETENARLANDLEKLEQSAAPQIELDEVRKKLTAAIRTVENVTNNNQELSSEIRLKADELQKLDEMLNDVKIENESLRNSTFSLQSMLRKKTSFADKLLEEKVDLETDLDQITAQVSLLTGQLEVAKVEIENLKLGARTGFKLSEAFSLGSEWNDLKQWITPQQIRFCSILKEYEIRKVAARKTGNQLKQNLAVLQRDEDIDALLLGRSKSESGYFRNWIGRVESVFAIQQENPDNNQVELAAGVVIVTPCSGVTIGSGQIVSETISEEEYAAVAFANDPIYTQLAQVSQGDPVIFDGSLLTHTADISNTQPKFITNVDGSDQPNLPPEGKLRDNIPDYFVSVEYLSKL